MKLTVWLPFITIVHLAQASRILVLIPFTGTSHYLNIKPLLQELVFKGHDLTVISPNREENPKYRQILTPKWMIWETFDDPNDVYKMESWSGRELLEFVWDTCGTITELALNTTEVQDLIANDRSHFDVILYETFFTEAMLMFAYKYKAPVVALNTFGYSHYVGQLMGNPLMASYIPHEMLNMRSDMTFTQRLNNLYSILYDFYRRKTYVLPRQQRLADKYFASLQQPLPDIGDLEKNISVVLINTHFSYDMIRPYVAGVVEVGGIHVKEAKPLPQNIMNFLDGAKDGAIFFSLGSNIQCKDMAPDKIQAMLKVFARLKQRVLWKWEDEDLPGKPDNVMVSKWLPQNDILGHKNMKLFITHGGLLSLQESMYHGVPVIGFPFYGDQHMNMQRVEASGFGLKLDFSTMDEQILETSIRRLVEETQFKARAEEISFRFKDRPLTAMQTAIYWIEYVIRHKGAPQLKSPALGLSFLVYNSLDILLVVLGLLMVVMYKISECFKMSGNKKRKSGRQKKD